MQPVIFYSHHRSAASISHGRGSGSEWGASRWSRGTRSSHALPIKKFPSLAWIPPKLFVHWYSSSLDIHRGGLVYESIPLYVAGIVVRSLWIPRAPITYSRNIIGISSISLLAHHNFANTPPTHPLPHPLSTHPLSRFLNLLWFQIRGILIHAWHLFQLAVAFPLDKRRYSYVVHKWSYRGFIESLTDTLILWVCTKMSLLRGWREGGVYVMRLCKVDVKHFST